MAAMLGGLQGQGNVQPGRHCDEGHVGAIPGLIELAKRLDAEPGLDLGPPVSPNIKGLHVIGVAGKQVADVPLPDRTTTDNEKTRHRFSPPKPVGWHALSLRRACSWSLRLLHALRRLRACHPTEPPLNYA